MSRKLQIELEDEVFYQLNEICKGDKSVMQNFIVHALKERFNQSKDKILSGEKNSLEGYLKKGESGSRNYGVKGQGW